MELQKKKIFLRYPYSQKLNFCHGINHEWLAGEFFFGIENNKTKVQFLMILIKKEYFIQGLGYYLIIIKKNENFSK